MKACAGPTRAAMLLLLCTAATAMPQQWEELIIHVAPGDSTTCVYTNKQAAYFYAETGRFSSATYEGLNVLGQEYFEDYVIMIDGMALDRRQAAAEIHPDRLVRHYRKPRLREEVVLLDSLNAVAITVVMAQPHRLTLLPAYSGGHRQNDFERHVLAESTLAAVALRSRLQGATQVPYPLWSGVRSAPGGHLQALPEAEGQAWVAQLAGPAVIPWRHDVHGADSTTFFLVVASDLAELSRLANFLPGNSARLQQQRRARMQSLLAHSDFVSNLPAFDAAVRWARLSLDALIMNQQGKGIFAGLPWFNNYWGRDTFISLAGATLVTGHYDEAREILRSFARFQVRDPNDPRDGRIPNRAMPGEVIYNTADGTPWFIRAALDYWKHSGDREFARELLPVLSHAIRGALAHQVDSLGFFVHEDADTWMDAVGPGGPWSPRGDRAVEIQVLWYEALSRTVELATAQGDRQLAQECRTAAQRLRRNFSRHFWNAADSRLFDHLNPEGTPDLHNRPNQIFAVAVPQEPLLTATQAASVTATVISRLTYPHGVASLDQQDDQFHPYHHHAPYYVQDAAYHNGIVWTWLSGPVITALCRFGRQDLAWRLMLATAEQILERGTRGTQSELLDALPRPGAEYPRLSGTVSQAWNLAEFIRNLHQDLLGVSIDAIRNRLVLRPLLPDSMHLARFTAWVGNHPVHVRYEQEPAMLLVTLKHEASHQELRCEVWDAASRLTTEVQLPPHQQVTLRFDRLARKAHSRGSKLRTTSRRDADDMPPQLVHVNFAQPVLRADLPALRGPAWPMLKSAQAVLPFPELGALSWHDPSGDDTGPNGRYLYPQNPAFEPGIFDLLGMEIATQDTLVLFRLRFRRLVQPGWHPEYGYQLTYTALALDLDRDSGTGTRELGMNSNTNLPETFGADRLIFLGGGAKVVEASGKTLVEFVPNDPRRTPGDARAGTITLALPARHLPGDPRQWRVALYSGGQDDHGGAGIGEFREVRQHAGEWHGGGGDQATGYSNVYDQMITP